MKNQPIHAIRLGTVPAAIFENLNSERPWHTITVSRNYKAGDEWKRSDKFGREELPLVTHAVELAHAWIARQTPPPAATV